jgi:hypothetical protein
LFFPGENDPFLPLSLSEEFPTVDPNQYEPLKKREPREPVAARGDMTVETFLKTIGRGAEEHAGKFATFEALTVSSSETLKKLGVPVRRRRWILTWIEHYRQGVDPYFIPLNSRSKKNKFLSRRKPKTAAQKKRD